MVENFRKLRESDRRKRTRWAIVLVTGIFGAVVLVWLLFFNYSFSEFTKTTEVSKFEEIKDKISEFASVSSKSFSLLKESVDKGFGMIENNNQQSTTTSPAPTASTTQETQ